MSEFLASQLLAYPALPFLFLVAFLGLLMHLQYYRGKSREHYSELLTVRRRLQSLEDMRVIVSMSRDQSGPLPILNVSTGYLYNMTRFKGDKSLEQTLRAKSGEVLFVEFQTQQGDGHGPI